MEILDDLKRKFPYWIDPGIVSLKLERGDDFYGLRYKYADEPEMVEKLDFISDEAGEVSESLPTLEQAKEEFFNLGLFTLLMTMEVFGSMHDEVSDFYMEGYEYFDSNDNDNKFGIYYTKYFDETDFETVQFAWFENSFDLFNYVKFFLPFQNVTNFSFPDDANELWQEMIDKLVEYEDFNAQVLKCMEMVEAGEEVLNLNPYKLLLEQTRDYDSMHIHWVGSVQNIQDTKNPELKALLDDIPRNNMPLAEYHNYVIWQLMLYQILDNLDHHNYAVEYYIGDMLALYCTTDEERVSFLKDQLTEIEGFLDLVNMPRISKLNKNKAETRYSHYKAFFHEMLQKLLSENKEKN